LGFGAAWNLQNDEKEAGIRQHSRFVLARDEFADGSDRARIAISFRNMKEGGTRVLYVVTPGELSFAEEIVPAGQDSLLNRQISGVWYFFEHVPKDPILLAKPWPTLCQSPGRFQQ